MRDKLEELIQEEWVGKNCKDELIEILLPLFPVIKWVAITERTPPRHDEDYKVCVRNKNKEGGIPIQDIQQFTSDGVFVGGNPDVWEQVVYWAEIDKPPF